MNITRVIIRGHPLDRLAERGISRDDVVRIVQNPSSVWADTKNGSLVCSGTAANGQTLRVCLVDPPGSDGTARVKTAFYV